MIPEDGTPQILKGAVLHGVDAKHRSMTEAQLKDIESRSVTPVPGDVQVLISEVRLLRKALADAILNQSRVSRTCVDYDPAGSTYELDWLPDVKEWAALCELDLEKHDPFFFSHAP